MALSSSLLRHPEQLHPLLWRANQLARPAGPVVPTGHPGLDTQLPGRGWPLGALVQCHLPRQAIGEILLLRPALQQLNTQKPVAFISPPAVPHSQCWANWQLQQQPMLWLETSRATDALWAAEQLLRHNVCSAVLCWAAPGTTAALRKLHLAAQSSQSLFFLFQPAAGQPTASIAPLRLALSPAPGGLHLHVLKRAGPQACGALFVSLHGTPPNRATDTTTAKTHRAPRVALPE